MADTLLPTTDAPEKHPLAHTVMASGKARKDVVTVQGFEEAGMRLSVERTAQDGQVAILPIDPKIQSRIGQDGIIALAGGGHFVWEIRDVHNKIVDRGSFDSLLPSVPPERIGTITAEAWTREIAAAGGFLGPPAQSVSLGPDGIAVIPKGSKADEVTAIVRETREATAASRLAAVNATTGNGALGAVMPLIGELVKGRSDPASLAAADHIRQVLAASDEQLRGARHQADELTATLRETIRAGDARVQRVEDSTRERESDLRAQVRDLAGEDRAEVSTRVQFWLKQAQAADDRARRIEDEWRDRLKKSEETKDAKIKELETDVRTATLENIRLERAQKTGDVAVQILQGVNTSPILNRLADRLMPAGSNGHSPAPGLPSGMEGFAEFLPLLGKHPRVWIAVAHAVAPFVEMMATHPQGPGFYTDLIAPLLANAAEWRAAMEDGEAKRRAAETSGAPG